ncbi:MAG TPA: DUF2341 domain-containing protein, partial [Candidatus Paceibacterota bacterium]|nr:DUF2341 domain-containing protein [Candidatus Paceibacterota bacterium]
MRRIVAFGALAIRAVRARFRYVLALVAIIVLFSAAGFVIAEREAVLYVFPNMIGGEGWENPDGALIQDYSPDAQFGDVARDASAWVAMGELKEAALTPVENTQGAMPEEGEPQPAAPVSSESQSEPTDDSAESNVPAATPDASAAPASAEPPLSEPSPSESAPTDGALRTPSTFTDLIATFASAPRAFAQDLMPAATIESADQNSVPEGATDSVSSDDPMAAPEVFLPASTETSTPAGTETASTSIEGIVDRVLDAIREDDRAPASARSVALCVTVGVPCRLLEFSGFGIGGALEGRVFSGATLEVSVASLGGEADGIHDTLIARAYHDGVWTLLGEEELSEERSGATRGGYLSFPLDPIDAWEDLDDLTLVIEYVNASGAAAEVRVDSAWISATYEAADLLDTESTSPANVIRTLAVKDAAMRADRRDTLALPDRSAVRFVHASERANAKLLIKTDRETYRALGSIETYFNVTNLSSEPEEFHLEFHAPTSSARFRTLERWTRGVPISVATLATKPVAYFCESGWMATTSEETRYACAMPEEVRTCDELNQDGTNCVAGGARTDVGLETISRDAWKPLLLDRGSFRDESGLFARAIEAIVGELPEDAIPDAASERSYAPETILLAPGQTAYFRAAIDVPMNARGEFFIEAAARSGAFGLVDLGWEGSWNWRIPIAIDQSGLAEAMQFVVPVDLSLAPDAFWSRVMESGADIRFSDALGTRELPFWLADWDRERREGRAWVAIGAPSHGTSTMIQLYYGDPDATPISDPILPFRTDVPTPRYRLLGSSQSDVTVHVLALADGVTAGFSDGELKVLSRGESLVADVPAGSIVRADGPIEASAYAPEASAWLVPYSYAGEQFMTVDPSIARMLEPALAEAERSIDFLPLGETEREIVDADGNGEGIDVIPSSTVSIPLPDSRSARFLSDGPVLAALAMDASRVPLAPIAGEPLLGLALGRSVIGAFSDGTGFTVFCERGIRRDIDGRRAGAVVQNDSCAIGSGENADAFRIAPTRGALALAFMDPLRVPEAAPRSAWSAHYALPDATDRIIVLCDGDRSTEVGVFAPTRTLLASSTCVARGAFPAHAIIDAPLGTVFPASSDVRSLDIPSRTFGLYVRSAGSDPSRGTVRMQGSVGSRGATPLSAPALFGGEEFVIPGEHRLLDRNDDGEPVVHANDLVIEKREFSAREKPTFTFRYRDRAEGPIDSIREAFGARPFVVERVRVVHQHLGEIPVTAEIVYGEGFEWTLTLADGMEKLRPGKYRLEVTIDDSGEEVTDAFDFFFGVLALNTDRSVYVPGDTMHLAMGALSDNGNTICDARLKLWIRDPSGVETEIPVKQSGMCNGNNIVDVPDYTADYPVAATGLYRIKLVRFDGEENMAAQSEEEIEVRESVPYVVERSGPTRIYPLAHYPMTITIRALRDFSGRVIEKIPGDFTVIDRGNADLEREGDAITASWDLTMLEGETRTFTYTFDAPDRSPYLFRVGPLTLAADEGPGFVEARTWQIASDAAGKMMIYWDRAYTPTGWTCVSCLTTDPFYQRFAVGSSTFGGSGGTATHTPTAAATIYVTASTGVGPNTTNNTNNAPLNHTHTLTPQIGAASNNPAYRELRVLQSNSAGDPASIPGGAIAMFDIASSSLPSGWYRYAPLDGRFPRGENGSVSTGGSATHTHTATGTLSTSVGSGFRSQTNVASGASVTHTHTLSATTTTTMNHEPPYVEVLYAQLPATSTPSNYMIGMWDNTPPDGWVSLSDEAGTFSGKFLKASTTYGATGGSSSHAHGDLLNATTSAPSATNNYNASASNAQAPGTHTHQIDITGFSTDDHTPRYVEVVFAKRLSGIVLYAQNTYRIYANTNAITPTDPWPTGPSDLDENTPINSAAISTKPGSIVRLRMSLGVANSTSTPGIDAFKLQYAQTTDCAGTLNWSDVSSVGSTTALWRGYNNAAVTDGATLASLLLSTASSTESYTEANPSTTTPNQIDIGKEGEWDWVVEQHLANAGVNYCFRMTLSDGTPLNTYAAYPEILTNAAPNQAELLALFDNEKIGTTSPAFTFSASDPEGNDLDYEIQIDTSSIFAAPVVDRDSTVNPELFDNVSNPVNKAPFNSGDTITTQVTGLSNNTTYWWRVRAKDPNGSNAWGAWSTARSFTTDTTVTVSTWFQTTDPQFNNGNTLVGVEATTTDSVTLISGSTTGAFYGPLIDFDVRTIGTVWGSLAFNDLESAGDIKYHLEYLSATDTWALIPDGDLGGNLAGFDASPVSLLSIDPNTYDRIRIRADFTNIAGSPRLNDWTLSWGFTVNTPTLYVPFDNAIVSTTTPVFEFLATDPQSDSVTYQISWSTSPLFTSSTTRESNFHAGFQNLSNPPDTDPFDSGGRMRFTVQGADALTGSSTYFWRVRARDPLGGNTYSFWSDVWSHTVSTTTTVATWYQTADGQFDTDALTSFEIYGAGSLRVATNTGEAMIAYGEGTVQTPRYRIWNGTALGGESSALGVGATIQWVVLRASSVIGEYMLATLGSDRDVNVQVYDDGAWGNAMEMTSSAPSLSTRGFDVAYETLSGRALVVSCDGNADPSYRIWDGAAWAATGTIDVTGSNNCEWVRLASDPVSDEIILLERDTGSRYEAQVWNGTSWGSTTTLGSMIEFAHEGMAVEYEESGNQAIIAVSNGGNANFTWSAWNGTSWSAPATQGLGDDFEWGNLRRDRGSDAMTLCYVDHDNDIGAVRWNGAAWIAFVELETAGATKDGRDVDCVYENTAGRDAFSFVGYSDTTNTRYRYWNGAAWQAEASISTIANTFTDQLARAMDDRILGVFFENATLDLEFSDWNGTAWSATQTIEGSPSVTTSPYGEPFMIATKNPPTRATIISTSIDFDDGVSPAWKRISWSSSQYGSSTLAIQVEYLNASGTWALIPDSDLPNNSVGTTTGPISIGSLDTVIYNQIRLRGSGTCVLGACPYLHDWRVEWAEGIRISGTAKEHNLTTNVLSGTVGVAVNGNLQVGKTGTIVNGDWFIDNVTVFPNQIITLFIDSGADANEAVTVGKYTTAGDIGGFVLAERWVTVGSASTTASHTLADLSSYDNSVSGDEDLFFDVGAGGDFTACVVTGCGDASVRVLAGNTFRPNASTGKTLNMFDMRLEGILASDANTFKLGGHWRNLGTLLAHTSTFVFNATTSTRTIDSTGAAQSIFYNVTFGESGSTAQWNLSSPLTATGTTAISFGTLSPGANALTLEGDLTIGASGIFAKGSATTTFSGATAKTWTDNTASKQDL